VQGPEQLTEKIYGDICYKAPEVLQGRPYNNKADSWNFGILIYFMLTL